ncbi:sugar phosphate nucleotidyltransferase [Candidatus Undinarchaeota archaeon]
MKGVILAAGKGTRLKPLTDKIPKPLVKINGKPLILYSIDYLKRAGIKDIGIVVGYKKEQLKKYLGNGSKFGVRITYITQKKTLGIANAIKYTEKFIGNSSFVVILPDNLFSHSLKTMVSKHKKSGAEASVGVKEVDNPSQLGVVELDQKGKVERLIEKPKNPPTNLAAVGIYLFSSNSVFNVIDNLKPSRRGEYEITDTLQKMVDLGMKVNPLKMEGWWKDTGNFIDLDVAEALVKGGTALVTGGAGFLGSWLCEYLLNDGMNVICLDNFSSGRAKNVKHLMKNPKFKFIKHDVTKPFDYPKKIDYIFHFASRASPPDFYKYPIDIMLSNSIGTLNFLNLAVKKNARFLLASTSEVYGDPKEHPQKETYWGNVNPIGVRSCYDESKRFAEALVKSFEKEKNLDVRIVRIFNTYGPRMKKDDGRLTPNVINQALKGKPLTIYGNGKQTRSFCYVTDLVKGIIKLMYSKNSGAVVNIGNPVEYSVLQTAKTIKRLTNSKSSFKYKPLPNDDPCKRRPDITKAKELLDWKPIIGIEEGLKKTIEYYKG